MSATCCLIADGEPSLHPFLPHHMAQSASQVTTAHENFKSMPRSTTKIPQTAKVPCMELLAHRTSLETGLARQPPYAAKTPPDGHLKFLKTDLVTDTIVETVASKRHLFAGTACDSDGARIRRVFQV